MIDDMRWLLEHAFDCTISFNGHRENGDAMSDYVQDIDDEDWVDGDARAAAIRSGTIMCAQVYPNGSVTSYAIYGVDPATVVASARAHCEAEQDRWRKNGMVPIHERAAD